MSTDILCMQYSTAREIAEVNTISIVVEIFRWLHPQVDLQRRPEAIQSLQRWKEGKETVVSICATSQHRIMAQPTHFQMSLFNRFEGRVRPPVRMQPKEQLVQQPST